MSKTRIARALVGAGLLASAGAACAEPLLLSGGSAYARAVRADQAGEADALSILAERPAPSEAVGTFLVGSRFTTAVPERVRGRALPEGSDEDDFVSRTEVTTPARLAPYGYVDSGTSKDFAGRPITPTTAGAGFAYKLNAHSSVRLLSSYVVSSGPVTRPGDVGVGLSLRFER